MSPVRKRRRFKLSSRGRLFIVYVTATLAGSFFLAGYLAETAALGRMESSLASETLRSVSVSVGEWGRRLRDMVARQGGVERARPLMQEFVTRVSDGGGVRLFVLDAHAQVLAHPRRNLYEARADLGWMTIEPSGGGAATTLREIGMEGEEVGGLYRSVQGPQGHMLSVALPLSDIGLLVVAERPKSRIDSRVRVIRGQFRRVRVLMIGVIFLLVIPGILVLTWWYEQRLEGKVSVLEWVTRELDKRTTELQERNEIIEERNKKIEELAAVREEYMGILAHDFRSPLTNIRMAAELLEQGTVGELTRRQGDLVGMILETGKLLTDLADDVLDLGRLEAGAEGLDREDTDVAELAREAMRGHVFLAESKGVKLSCDGPEVLTGSGLDKERMRQVLNNLVSNAIKFTPDGGKVTVGTAAVDGGLHLSVADTGRGIPRDELGRIFDKYAQVRRRKEHGGGREGTGLGLAICKRIVELHGGRIWAESEGSGLGSTFHMVVPARGVRGRGEPPPPPKVAAP